MQLLISSLVEEVQAFGEYKNNAEVIAAAHDLGYVEGKVLDLTYGEGAFWNVYRPPILVTNDLYKGKGAHHDFRATKYVTGSFDTVVFDPPYKLAGTPASGDMDDDYGTDVARTRPEVYGLLVGGMAEASRITKRWMLVKIADMVSSGAVRWQSQVATDVARALEFKWADSLHLEASRPQPEKNIDGSKRRQVHARRNYSTLLIFKRGR